MGGLWFVCTTLPFGWKCLRMSTTQQVWQYLVFLENRVYFARSTLMTALMGNCWTKSGPWSILYYDRQNEFGVKAARAAIFIVHSVLVELGYTIGISKSVLYPTTSLEYLGFLVDSEKQSFIIPQSKIVAWAFLQERILACKKCVDVKSLQRFQGKWISLSLALPTSKLFIREMSHAITTASSNGLVPLSQALRSEIIHWRFLDTVILQKWHLTQTQVYDKIEVLWPVYFLMQ